MYEAAWLAIASAPAANEMLRPCLRVWVSTQRAMRLKSGSGAKRAGKAAGIRGAGGVALSSFSNICSGCLPAFKEKGAAIVRIKKSKLRILNIYNLTLFKLYSIILNIT